MHLGMLDLFLFLVICVLLDEFRACLDVWIWIHGIIGNAGYLKFLVLRFLGRAGWRNALCDGKKNDREKNADGTFSMKNG